MRVADTHSSTLPKHILIGEIQSSWLTDGCAVVIIGGVKSIFPRDFKRKVHVFIVVLTLEGHSAL